MRERGKENVMEIREWRKDALKWSILANVLLLSLSRALLILKKEKLPHFSLSQNPTSQTNYPPTNQINKLILLGIVCLIHLQNEASFDFVLLSTFSLILTHDAALDQCQRYLLDCRHSGTFQTKSRPHNCFKQSRTVGVQRDEMQRVATFRRVEKRKLATFCCLLKANHA